MTLPQLKKAKRVVGISGGKCKTNAIPGALNGRWIDVLITDQWTARAVLEGTLSRSQQGGAMPIGQLILEVRIEHAQSVKDRRQVVRSLKDRLRNSFNISIAELDEAVMWNRATLGVAAISGSREYLVGLLAEVESAAHRLANGCGAEICDSYCEILPE